MASNVESNESAVNPVAADGEADGEAAAEADGEGAVDGAVDGEAVGAGVAELLQAATTSASDASAGSEIKRALTESSCRSPHRPGGMRASSGSRSPAMRQSGAIGDPRREVTHRGLPRDAIGAFAVGSDRAGRAEATRGGGVCTPRAEGDPVARRSWRPRCHRLSRHDPSGQDQRCFGPPGRRKQVVHRPRCGLRPPGRGWELTPTLPRSRRPLRTS